jgi:hypothetical protein
MECMNFHQTNTVHVRFFQGILRTYSFMRACRCMICISISFIYLDGLYLRAEYDPQTKLLKSGFHMPP